MRAFYATAPLPEECGSTRTAKSTSPRSNIGLTARDGALLVFFSSSRTKKLCLPRIPRIPAPLILLPSDALATRILQLLFSLNALGYCLLV